MTDNSGRDDKPIEIMSQARPVFVFGAGFVIGCIVGAVVAVGIF